MTTEDLARELEAWAKLCSPSDRRTLRAAAARLRELEARATDFSASAGTLLSRLRSRSRVETIFPPNSTTPELLRRSEELLDQWFGHTTTDGDTQ